MTPDETRAFLLEHHHAVLVTRRTDDRLQSSPVVCGFDGTDVLISVTRDRAKTKNLRRDPRAALCVFTDAFFGPWVQIEGEARIVDLPDAAEELRTLYRLVRGEHEDWDDYDAAMVRDRRCVIHLPVG